MSSAAIVHGSAQSQSLWCPWPCLAVQRLDRKGYEKVGTHMNNIFTDEISFFFMISRSLIYVHDLNLTPKSRISLLSSLSLRT